MSKQTIGPKEQQRRALREAGLDRARSMRSKPDTSDIPEAGDDWFKKAKLVQPGKAKKKRSR